MSVSIIRDKAFSVKRKTIKFSVDGQVSVSYESFKPSFEKRAVKNCIQYIYPDGSLEMMILKNEYIKGGSGKVKKEKVSPISEEAYKEKKMSQSRYRSVSKIRRLIKCNDFTFHWVLTYRQAGKDRSAVSKDFKDFIKRLNYALYGKEKKLPYLAVIELQKGREKKHKEKALHFHLATSERIPVKMLEKCWSFGFVLVKRYQGASASKIASYLSKYLKKEIDADGIRKGRQKRYFSSKGLKEPERVEFFMTEKQKKELLESAKKIGVYHKELFLSDGSKFAEWLSG
jgi:hypothetical protein